MMRRGGEINVMQRRRVWIWAVIVGLVGLGLAVALNLRSIRVWHIFRGHPEAREMFEGRELHDLDELTEWTAVEFPSGVQVLNSWAFLGFRYSLLAKVAMPVAGVPELLSSLPPDVQTSSMDRLGVHSGEGYPRWWRPDSARRFMAVRAERRSPNYDRTLRGGWRWESFEMLIDLDDADTAVLYVSWAAE